MSVVSHTQLTPLRFLERSAEVYPDKVAIVHGDRRMTYREFAGEATRLARALQASGIEAGDRVAYLCPNIPELLIAHFAVPLAGAVLVAINSRLAGQEVRYICEHSGAKLLVVDSELRSTVAPVQDQLETVREIVTITDPAAEPDVPEAPEGPSYEDLLERGSDAPLDWAVEDELATITINYTSGTTGKPKGVMYTHRGAYLNSLGRGAPLRARARLRLPVDAPDVPLQRVVHGLGRDRDRRPPRVPARGARRPHLAAPRAGEGHAPERRPHGAHRPWPMRRRRIRWSDRWW